MVSLQEENTTLPVETGVGNYFISNYPPYSAWSRDQIPEMAAALDGLRPREPLCLYVHLPFCSRRCRYCYFRVHAGSLKPAVDVYLDSLLTELSLHLEHRAFRDRELIAAYFGGGSPSYLSEEQIRRLLGGLQERLSWDNLAECTFECEPATTTAAKLAALKELGVTRITLGFQTLDDAVLKLNGREARARDSLAAFHLAREAGFREINVDLLAGLPGETAQSWQETVERVLQLAPDCVTIYQFELTHNSILYLQEGEACSPSLPNWAEKRRWVGRAFRKFEDVGYTVGSGYMAIRNSRNWKFVYTVDNFWHGGDLLALGESAFGHLQGVHYQNSDSFTDYVTRLVDGQLPLWRARRLTGEEQLRREVILQLKTGVLDAGYFSSKYGVDLREKFQEELEGLRRDHLLEFAGGRILLTRDGLLKVDWLLPRFYLPEHRGIRYT